LHSEGWFAARDKPLLLVGFVVGLRHSKLAAIRVEHLGWHRIGCTIRIFWSKHALAEMFGDPSLAIGRSLRLYLGLPNHGRRQRYSAKFGHSAGSVINANFSMDVRPIRRTIKNSSDGTSADAA
jgi:integrase